MPDNFMDDVACTTLYAISEAQKDYKCWTGGYWLWKAPEYMITTYIAKHISAIKDRPFYLTLENKVRDAIDDAGGMGSGKESSTQRRGGKFDILLWWGNDTPRAVIEVKNRVRYFSDIETDVSRICDTLNRPKTKFRDGFIAYYTFDKNNKHTPVKCIVKEVAKEAKEFANSKGKSFKRYSGEIKVEEDGGAWAAEVLKISRRR